MGTIIFVPNQFMNKRIQFFIFFMIFVLLLPTQASHAVGNTVLGVSTVYKESTGTVEFVVFIHSDEKVAGGSFDLVYDETLLSVSKSNVKTSDLLSTQLVSVNSETKGKISAAWGQVTGMQIKGDLLTIKGSVSTAGKGKNIPLKLKNVEIINENGKKVSVKVVNGAIKPFDGEVITHSSDVSVNKEDWTIHLNTPYLEGTLNEHAVTMKRGTTTVPISIEKVNSTTFKVIPLTQYSKTKYTLEITEQLTSNQGSQLQPVRFEFTVK